MPNLTFDTLDSVPEGLKEHAKENPDTKKFVVNVVPEVKLAEFRDNNVRISQERDTLAGVVQKLKPIVGDNVDGFVSEFGELKTLAQRVKDGKLQASDAIEAEVANRVAQMKTSFEAQNQQTAAQLAEANRRAEQADNKYRSSIISRAVTEAVVNEKSGANPGALEDILTRAMRVFQVGDDGKMIAKNGDAIIYGADGATPITPLEWLGKLRESAGYLFKGSNGGGASGGTVVGNGYKGTGMTEENWSKLKPEEKLRRAHAQKQKTA
jgi:hypothetical protein